MKAMLINPIGGDGGVLKFDRKLLRERFNRLPFEFDHGLAGHPLFEKDRLIELARFLPNGDVCFNDGNIDVNGKWSKIGRSAGTIENAIGNIEESGSWIILKKVNQDPQYRLLMEEAMTNLEDSLGRRVRPTLEQLDAFIFMASPGGVTPLHIDAECTFLCQISGEKRVNVFDPTDREVLPHEEIERFHYGQLESATYRPEFKSRAHNFTIRSGTGVHLPIIAPHWVENYKNISCSFSIISSTMRIESVGASTLPTITYEDSLMPMPRTLVQTSYGTPHVKSGQRLSERSINSVGRVLSLDVHLFQIYQ